MAIFNIINVSGGKDSTALLLLAKEREAENLQAWFADTGHEHPQTYDYITYLSEKVYPIRTIKADFSKQIARKRDVVQTKWRKEGIPEDQIQRALQVLVPTNIPFLDLCLWKGRFPSTKARFCTEELKRNPIVEEQLDLVSQGNTIYSWQGVRADESESRSKLPELEDLGGGIINYRPILSWTADDCFAMHRKHNIAHNPLYEQGMGRVGCMPCIHVRKDELLEIGRRFPAEVARVAEWERLVKMASKRNGATLLNKGPGGFSNEEAQKEFNIYEMIRWSKTSKRRDQYDFFRMQEGSACSSIYGLCE